MKPIFLLMSLAFLMSCRGKITENTMVVAGQVKGLKKGTLYLQHIRDSTLVVLDSMEIDGNGDFSFSTEIESPDIFYLYLSKNDNNKINDRITFFGEPGNITINTSWNTFDTNAKIEGSASHKKLEEYRRTMSQINKRNLELARVASDTESGLDSLQLDSIGRLSEKNVLRGYLYALNFALNNTDSYVAPYIALSEVPDANIKYLDSIAKLLTSEVADSKYGRQLQQLVTESKSE